MVAVIHRCVMVFTGWNVAEWSDELLVSSSEDKGRGISMHRRKSRCACPRLAVSLTYPELDLQYSEVVCDLPTTRAYFIVDSNCEGLVLCDHSTTRAVLGRSDGNIRMDFNCGLSSDSHCTCRKTPKNPLSLLV